MPELPEVETFRQYLDATSLHKTITQVEVRSTQILRAVTEKELQEKLVGHRLQSTRRHGKHLLAEIDDQSWLTIHFGMTGSLYYFKNMDKDPPHDRFLVTFSNSYHLAFDCQRKLGRIGLTQSPLRFIEERKLGPDALRIDSTTLDAALAKRRGCIKQTLMNQQVVAGIGNLYSDEILFQSKVHPESRVQTLEAETRKRIREEIHDVLQTAVACRADFRRFPKHYLIHQRYVGGRCPRCSTELERIRISGRTAYLCPRDQETPFSHLGLTDIS